MTLLLPLERTRVGWLVEVEAVNPWRVLHRFYGNVRPLPPCQTSGARDIANLFPLLVRRSREGWADGPEGQSVTGDPLDMTDKNDGYRDGPF